jgi:amidase
MSSVLSGGMRRSRRATLVSACAAAAAAAIGAAPASAINYVPSANGGAWGIHDAAAPGLDTGSVRDSVDNSLRGFGGIRVRVSGGLTPAPRLNGELMRGFGLRFDGLDRFATTDAVNLAGLSIRRAIRVERTANQVRYLDTFTNTSARPILAEIAFGGQTGSGVAATTQSRVVDSSSGDTTISNADSWAEVATSATAAGPTPNGPSAVVIGSPSPFTGGLTRAANFLRNPWDEALALAGHESNFFGYLNRITLQPGETRTLMRFVVVGYNETTTPPLGGPIPAAGSQIAAVKTAAQGLATSPPVGDLTTAEICELANWVAATLTAADCTQVQPLDQQGSPQVLPATTSSPYDVVDKTIQQMRADMQSGATTSAEITRAYLDRIAAYDTGQFGFHSMTFIAEDAMDQAREADRKRALGATGPLLGIPVAVKDLYDTKDMPTTNGSLVFEGFRPTKDATQVKLMRDAGAVIIGKSTMSEYANSGHFSDSAWGQVWNAFEPSKSSIGSSGGSGVSTALSFNAFSMGSQTGDSLWGPSSAASLYSLRGTDGMTSNYGAMPLTWLQDYTGAITRSVSDLADVLNVTTGTDPKDFRTVEASARRPVDWRTALDPNALRGKRLGYASSAFQDPFGTTGTRDALMASFANFTAAGATVFEIPAPPNAPPAVGGDRGYEGWQRWLDDHPESSYDSPVQIITSPKRLPYSRQATYTGTGPMTPSQVDAWIGFRTEYKARLAAWMDANNVDAVIYPGMLSDINLNDGVANSFGRLDPQSSASGVPSVIFPATVNDHGEPANLQLMGRAWDDAKLIGFAYAFDRQARAHIAPATAPKLGYAPSVPPKPIVIEKPPTPVTTAPAPDPVTNVVPPRPPLAAKAPGTAPAPAVVASARLRVLNPNAAADSKGRFTVLLSCSGKGTCGAKLTLRRSGKLVASKTVSVKAGARSRVLVATSGSTRRSLARGSRIKVRVVLAPRAGTAVSKPGWTVAVRVARTGKSGKAK